jgi:hypothetical protein
MRGQLAAPSFHWTLEPLKHKPHANLKLYGVTQIILEAGAAYTLGGEKCTVASRADAMLACAPFRPSWVLPGNAPEFSQLVPPLS